MESSRGGLGFSSDKSPVYSRLSCGSPLKNLLHQPPYQMVSLIRPSRGDTVIPQSFYCLVGQKPRRGFYFSFLFKERAFIFLLIKGRRPLEAQEAGFFVSSAISN